MFENLHGKKDHGALTERLVKLAVKHHGHAGRAYLTGLQAWRNRDPEELKRYLDERRAYYLTKAKSIEAANRDLSRFHEKFATIYAAGCLAIKFNILPWKRKDVLAALISCEQGHVDSVGTTTIGAKTVTTSPAQRLRDLLTQQRSRLANLRTKGSRRNAPSDPIGYIVSRGKNIEYLFTEEEFEKIAGGKAEVSALKRELHFARQIETTGKGKKLRFAVKRTLPGKSKRKYFVAVRGSFFPPE